MKENEVYFAKVREDAKIPTKRYEDAGYDLYPCFEESFIYIAPGSTVMIPTGIKSAFQPKYAALLKERGSTGIKGIAQRSGVIDSGFRGEWMCPITNTTHKDIFIIKKSFDFDKHIEYNHYNRAYIKDEQGNKIYLLENPLLYPYEKAIAQILFVEVPVLQIKYVEQFEVDDIPSCRGIGMLGSTSK